MSLELYRQMMLKDNLYQELLTDYLLIDEVTPYDEFESGSDWKRELDATLNYE